MGPRLQRAPPPLPPRAATHARRSPPLPHRAAAAEKFVATKKKPFFPFTRLAGQEDMKLALLLNVVDASIGGVLIMGDRGALPGLACWCLTARACCWARCAGGAASWRQQGAPRAAPRPPLDHLAAAGPPPSLHLLAHPAGCAGTGKSVAVRSLVDLLPMIDVVQDDPFNSSPTGATAGGWQGLTTPSSGARPGVHACGQRPARVFPPHPHPAAQTPI